MRRGLAALVCTGAVLGPAGGALAASKVVFAGPPPGIKKVAAKVLGRHFGAKYNPDINAFFTRRVTIHAGDSVKFFQDGFHTIDIPARGGSDLPFLVPGPIVNGVNDAAGNPFWFDGKVPNLGLNPAILAPSKSTVYDGTARVESGLPAGSGKPKPFTVTFTKPGVYRFFCDIHPGMTGTIVVRAKGKRIPSAAKDTAALAAQMASDVLAAKRLARTKVPKDQVDLGVSSKSGVELFGMFPATLTVQRGTVVTFVMSRHSRETHTATFGPASYLKPLAQGFRGGPFFPAQGVYPSDPTQPIPGSATAHGNGFFGTGALDRDKTTPVPFSSAIRFTQKGVYHFICLIHPFMHGTIIVK